MMGGSRHAEAIDILPRIEMATTVVAVPEVSRLGLVQRVLLNDIRTPRWPLRYGVFTISEYFKKVEYVSSTRFNTVFLIAHRR